MHRTRAVGSICLLALFAPVAAEASPDTAMQWLQRTEQAVRETSFRGTFVYVHGGHLETIRVYHKADSDGHRERLVSRTGAAREVIRDRDGVRCILPGSESLSAPARRSTTHFPSGLINDPEALQEGYRLRFSETGRIADRQTVRILAVPRDEYRYGHRLWLDRISAIPLKSELVDGDGETLEKVMFTDFEAGVDIPDRQLRPSVSIPDDGHPRRGREPRVAGVEEDALNVTWMPPGFRQVSEQTRQLAGGGDRVRHMVYSDGLASVSLFVERIGDGSGMLEGESRMGAVNAFGLPVNENTQLTVVGEVPAAAVRRIAESVVFSRTTEQ